jgi:hypothetical protein
VVDGPARPLLAGRRDPDPLPIAGPAPRSRGDRILLHDRPAHVLDLGREASVSLRRRLLDHIGGLGLEGALEESARPARAARGRPAARGGQQTPRSGSQVWDVDYERALRAAHAPAGKQEHRPAPLRGLAPALPRQQGDPGVTGKNIPMAGPCVESEYPASGGHEQAQMGLLRQLPRRQIVAIDD